MARKPIDIARENFEIMERELDAFLETKPSAHEVKFEPDGYARYDVSFRFNCRDGVIIGLGAFQDGAGIGRFRFYSGIETEGERSSSRVADLEFDGATDLAHNVLESTMDLYNFRNLKEIPL
jgi:hypothetical protein